ncbi:DUF4348 domain-containing protein [Aquimarina muelleri]|uniref:DUF4348 domain-containing protein n=1 Tax=Aquimarina muelleri TaxID=279356 RepID=A0A918JU74_9FLAO|nr:DUF4348 domain-containing protein [Aquimarina muelleri]MCX2762324.1 DUF4348 domain-containing protein [Aquimarina muelleri]GGX17560.1 hypothetical protein GCM10007384_18690 [Aquimarina muelleri]
MKNILSVIILLFLSCKKANNLEYKVSTEKTANLVKQQKSSKEDFNNFFVKFSNDSIFQKDRVKDTLYLHNLVEIDKFEVLKFTKEDISYMDFRDDTLAYKKEYDKYRVETVIKEDSTNYSMYGIDNGILLHYVFMRDKQNNEWYLTSIHDYSN